MALVANPMYAALSALYTQLEQDAPTMKNALKPADQQMSAGQTWVGPTAQGWGNQLNGYSGDCATQVNSMLAQVEHAMSSTPAQVTPEQAEDIGRTMALVRRESWMG
jgi:hypothetical protein